MTTKSIAALITLLACIFICPAVATAQSRDVVMSAIINGQDVSATSASNPVRLEPGESADIAVELTNRGTEPVTVRNVHMSGRVVGLTFFSYATSVHLTVQPGATDTLRYQLDLIGLDGQATGLIGGAVTVTDAQGDPIASIPMVTDVRGSLISVYGLFGIVLVILTALALIDAALALARHRLSQNRWQRGLRLLAPGVGIGLVIAFTASVARLWVPNTGLWLVLAGLTAAVFFALGYFSPTPPEDDEEGLDEEDEALSDADTQLGMSTDEFGR